MLSATDERGTRGEVGSARLDDGVTDRPIEDHALLSDSNSSALVGRDGSIDWATFPRFDAAPIFARLLDDDAGHWSLRPAGSDVEVTNRRYLPGTMVLETTFATDGGVLVVTDAMALPFTEDPHDLGTGAPHAILRRATCSEGSIEVETVYSPRPEFGLMVPLLRVSDGGVFSLGGSWSLVLSASVPLDVDGDARAIGHFTLDQGEEAWFSLRRAQTYGEAPATWDPQTVAHWLDETIREWEGWSEEHQHYEGRWRDLVHVSGRVLQSLTYWPTGAIVAAPTTSLPETIGGERNWDYRYCWVRDTALTLEALRVSACTHEAGRFLDWIVRTAGGDLRAGQDLQIMYGIGGEHTIGESILPHLSGWRDSAPVRIGNDAWHQRQLDVYGELMDALFELRHDLGDLREVESRFVRDLADAAMERWGDTDRGIWEIRAEPRHHVHSKLMCWVALDRALQIADVIGAEDRVDDWRAAGEEIRRTILERGWNDELGAFTQTLDGDALDASILVMPIAGFLPADDPRMVSTMDAIEAHLTDDVGFVYRYRAPDGLHGEEGTFLLCTFWLAQCRAMAGQVDEAVEVFERVVAHVNDVGLLAEQLDRGGARLGNFPQAFSHIGLVNAAQAIERASAGRQGTDER